MQIPRRALFSCCSSKGVVSLGPWPLLRVSLKLTAKWLIWQLNFSSYVLRHLFYYRLSQSHWTTGDLGHCCMCRFQLVILGLQILTLVSEKLPKSLQHTMSFLPSHLANICTLCYFVSKGVFLSVMLGISQKLKSHSNHTAWHLAPSPRRFNPVVFTIWSAQIWL